MTYTFTHLSLEGLIIWNLLPKKDKEYFKDHMWYFIVANIFAILPDFDIFFAIHRMYTHSIIIPVFILLILLLLEGINGLRMLHHVKGETIIRILKYSLLMWIFHILLDIGWGPLLLFWPLDNHFYDFTCFFRFSTQSTWLLPLVLVGIIPDWRIYSLKQGQSSFFINLSSQQRQAVFGNSLDLSIEELTLHIFIFLTWIIVILVPAFYQSKTRKEEKNSKKSSKSFILITRKVWQKLNRQLTWLGLFIILLGLIIGPAIGKYNSYNNSFSVSLVSTTTKFDPTLGFILNKNKDQTITLNITTEKGVVDYNSTFMLLNKKDFFYFFESFDNITNAYRSRNISFPEVIHNYRSLVNNASVNSLVSIKLIFNNSLIFKINNALYDDTYYVLYVINEWNTDYSFVYDTSVTINYITERTSAFNQVFIIISLGAILILTDQFIDYKSHKK